MLSSRELNLVYQRAYIPEHLPNYVKAISGTKSYLHGDYLCYFRKKRLIFVGYPLVSQKSNLEYAFDSACERFQPDRVSIIAPQIWLPDAICEKHAQDTYYSLPLPVKTLAPGLSYMVRRASREVRITEGTFGREHRGLIKEFIFGRQLAPEYEFVFERIPYYLKNSPTARLLEARKQNSLVAFTIMDLGSAHYAFYLFSFRSEKEIVPGASDLLFWQMATLAQSQGKANINLGLGIHPGICRFKEKWGGKPFLPYASGLVRRQPFDIGSLADKL
jgi:hypothetical protein